MIKEYRLDLYHSAKHYPKYENKIEEVLKTQTDGSGMGLGQRDFSFIFKTKQQLKSAILKIKKLKLKGLKGTKTIISPM